MSDDLYGFKYFTKADGIQSWKSGSLKFGDALAALSYAHGITWEQLKQEFPDVFSFNEFGRGESLNASLIKPQIEFLEKNATRHPKRVLEIGGGRGEVATALAHMGIDVVSVEPGSGAERWYASTAEKFFGHLEKPVVPVVKFIQDAMVDIDLSTFDTILMVESLEHIPEDQFEGVWESIRTEFKGRMVIVNWPDYHPIWIGRDAGPLEHCRLVDDALYDKWSAQAKECVFRMGSHLVLDF